MAFFLILIGVTLVNPGFIAPDNLVDILYNSSYIAVAAVGMTMIILCGHIDISIGAAVGFARPSPVNFPLWGFRLDRLYRRYPGRWFDRPGQRPPGRLWPDPGHCHHSRDGQYPERRPDSGYWRQMDLWPAPGFRHQPGIFFGVPLPICAMLFFGTIFSVWLKYYGSGRQLYAVGGNAEAARLSGISDRHVTLRVFVLNGLLVGIAAILYATNFTSIQANAAHWFGLTVITAAVVGGVSIMGGAGTIVGAIMGAVLAPNDRDSACLYAYSGGMVSNCARESDPFDHSSRCFSTQADGWYRNCHRFSRSGSSGFPSISWSSLAECPRGRLIWSFNRRCYLSSPLVPIDS